MDIFGKRQIEEHEKKINNMQSEINSLRNRIKEKDNWIAEQNSKISSISTVLRKYSDENTKLREEVRALSKTNRGLRDAINKWRQRALRRQPHEGDLELKEYMTRLERSPYKKREKEWRIYITYQQRNTSYGIEHLEEIKRQLQQRHPDQELQEIRLRGEYIEYRIAEWLKGEEELLYG